MHYATICPTAYLDQYAGRGHFQLCLAQVAMRDAKYFEWYKRRREAGDFVILDNGAYEGELVAPEELTRLALQLNPNVTTIPDKINDAKESEKMARDFLQRNEGSLMRVLQSDSRDVEEWVYLYTHLERKYSWVAFPRVLGDLRPAVVVRCRELRTHDHNTHAFGWTGNLNEVRQLAKLGVTSIDTSAPVWRGFHGLALGNENVEAWERNGDKFNPYYLDPTSIQEHKDVIESNLQAMQRACAAF